MWAVLVHSVADRGQGRMRCCAWQGSAGAGHCIRYYRDAWGLSFSCLCSAVHLLGGPHIPAVPTSVPGAETPIHLGEQIRPPWPWMTQYPL